MRGARLLGEEKYVMISADEKVSQVSRMTLAIIGTFGEPEPL